MPSRIIGGLFGLESISIDDKQASPFRETSLRYFLNVRCALHALCRALRPKQAWLPSYLCSAILGPFGQLGVPVRFYDDGPNFQPEDSEWTSDVASGDLVVAIHYFGFPNRTFPAVRLENQGAVIVEDASHALYLKQQYPASLCILYSPRKFLGVPDGGLMASLRSINLNLELLEPPPIEWWKKAFAMTLMRRDFDLIGGENLWFPLFRQVEETFPLGSYRSSDLTKVLIETGTDYSLIRKRRRENYLVLLHRLQRFALFPSLDVDTVPLGFPVCVQTQHRDEVLSHLYAERIYAPVHWRVEGIVPQEYTQSHVLSRRIMTLICDQRYTTFDMERQAHVFLTALNNVTAAQSNK